MTGTEASPLRSYAWACSQRGALNPKERAEVARRIRQGYAEIARGVLSLAFGHRPPLRPLPSAPDSKLAHAAEDAAREQGADLAGHGYRTWAIGTLLADHDGVELDPELLYVVGLLHDFGLVKEVSGEDFTIRSGRRLIELADEAGCGEATGARMADSAVAHATPGLRPTEDAIGFYVQWGAMADLCGLRAWDLPRGAIRDAYRVYPGNGIHGRIPRLIRREATDVPTGRFALLRRSGVALMVRFSPTRRYDREH